MRNSLKTPICEAMWSFWWNRSKSDLEDHTFGPERNQWILWWSAYFGTPSQKESQVIYLQLHRISTVVLQSGAQFYRLRIDTRTRLFYAEYEFVGCEIVGPAINIRLIFWRGPGAETFYQPHLKQDGTGGSNFFKITCPHRCQNDFIGFRRGTLAP